MDDYLWVLKDSERDLVRELEPERLDALDEDGLLALHKRVRRARNKHVTNYRRRANKSVAEAGGRGAAAPKGAKSRLPRRGVRGGARDRVGSPRSSRPRAGRDPQGSASRAGARESRHGPGFRRSWKPADARCRHRAFALQDHGRSEARRFVPGAGRAAPGEARFKVGVLESDRYGWVTRSTVPSSAVESPPTHTSN